MQCTCWQAVREALLRMCSMCQIFITHRPSASWCHPTHHTNETYEMCSQQSMRGRTYTLPTHAWGLGDPGRVPGWGWWLVAERVAHAVGSTVRTLHCCPDAATTLHTSLMKCTMRDAKGCCPTSPWGHGPLTPRTQGPQLATDNGWFFRYALPLY